MSTRGPKTLYLYRAASMLAATLLATTLAVAGEPERGVFVLTSTNNPAGNDVVVFKLDTAGTPSLSLTGMLPAQGRAVRAATPEFCSSGPIPEPWPTTDQTASVNWYAVAISSVSQQRSVWRLVACSPIPSRSPGTICSWSARIVPRVMRGPQAASREPLDSRILPLHR